MDLGILGVCYVHTMLTPRMKKKMKKLNTHYSLLPLCERMDILIFVNSCYLVCEKINRCVLNFVLIFSNSTIHFKMYFLYMCIANMQGRQTGLKSGGAERDFLRLRDLEARDLGYVRDFETKKSGGAYAPARLAPFCM